MSLLCPDLDFPVTSQSLNHPRMMLVSLFAVAFTVLIGTGDALKWNQCGNKNSVVVNDLDMTPSPLKMPGSSKLTLDLSILRQLNGSNVKISMSRNSMLGWIKIPCLFGLGSCAYKDTCTLMHRMMDENWDGIMRPIITQIWAALQNVGAKMDCPVPVQKFRLDNVEVALPEFPVYPEDSIFSKLFKKGTYKIKFHSKDKNTKESILCLEWEMTVA